MDSCRNGRKLDLGTGGRIKNDDYTYVLKYKMYNFCDVTKIIKHKRVWTWQYD